MQNRYSNIELLRICCMVMIISGHIMMNHQSFYSLTDSDEILKLLFRGAFCVAVNAFVLISGYFGLKFKKEKLVHLVIQTFFYSATFMVLAILLGWHVYNPKTDFFAFMPIITKQYWFITCYIVLYIISPWLNIWVDSLEKRKYKKFLIVGFLFFYLWPTFSFLINAPRFIDDSGYGIVNFIYLYMLGRYLRLYYESKHSSKYYWGGYIISSILLFLCQYSLSWFLGFEYTSWISYNTVLCLIGSICLFWAFKEMSFHSSLVNYLAKPCLAVYLIHMAPFVFNKFCIFLGVQDYHGFSFLFLVFILPILIYIICAIIEICRMLFLGGIERKIISLVVK